MKTIQVGSINKCIEPLSGGAISYETPLLFRREAQVSLLHRNLDSKKPAIQIDTIRHALMNQEFMEFDEQNGVVSIVGKTFESGLVRMIKMEFRPDEGFLDLTSVDLVGEFEIGDSMFETKKLIRQNRRKNRGNK